MPDRDFNFLIEEHLGVINRSDTGWTRELNIVSWNGQAPKYDIRDWDPDHERMSKGITLFDRDMKVLVDLYLKDRNRRVVSKAQEEKEARDKRRKEGPRTRWQAEEENGQAAAEAAEADAMAYLSGEGQASPEQGSPEDGTAPEQAIEQEPEPADETPF